MIQVERLSKSYGDSQALRSVSFEVPPGVVCGYLGPNGAGKSTTVRILTGVLQPSEGLARVAGFDVAEAPLEVKRRVGYVPESGALYSMLCANEYMALVGALHQMEPAQVVEQSGRLFELFQISQIADRRLDSLSKGLRQKVVLSAALLHDPDVVLLDEPFSGLDANVAVTLKRLIRGLADRGKTVLFCSHMLDVVERICERVIILHQGRVVAAGRTSELISSSRKDSLETVFRSLTSSEDEDELSRAIAAAIGQEARGREMHRQGVPSSRHPSVAPGQTGKGRSRWQ